MAAQSVNLSRSGVLWGQVCGLAAVQGAIALMWVIYNLYLAELLVQMGLPRSLAAPLLIVENLLAMVMEPLMGSLSDQLQQQIGTRLPLISLGVILAAGAFISLPAIALTGSASAGRWALLAMTIAWALAMTVFRSPALSLLGRYALATRLPQAASILTLVGGVAGAMGPLAGTLILSWGAGVAFGIGSGVLLLATVALRWLQPQQSVRTEAASVGAIAFSWRRLAFAFGAGVGITLGFRVLMMRFSGVLADQVTDAAPRLVLGSIFVMLALTAIPAGTIARWLGNRRAMLMGLSGMACVGMLLSIVQQNGLALVLALLLGMSLSLVFNGTMPFALSMVPASKAGLGTGMFFSGGAAAASLAGAIATPLQTVAGLGTGLGLLALLLAGFCVTVAPR